MSDSNAAVVYRNLADAGTVYASSQLIDAPGALVQTEHVGDAWVAPATTAHLICDLHGLHELDVIAAIGMTDRIDWTAPVDMTVRMRASAADPAVEADLLFDSGWGAVSPRYRQAIWTMPLIEARYLRLDLETNGGERVGFGRLVVGKRSVYRYNYGYGGGFNVIDPSVLSETDGGQTRARLRQKHRTVRVDFNLIEEADRWGFVEDMMWEAGVSKDILFLTDPSAPDLAATTVWGLRTESAEVVQPYPDHFAQPIMIKERR